MGLIRRTFYGVLALAYVGGCSVLVYLAFAVPENRVLAFLSGRNWTGW